MSPNTSNFKFRLKWKILSSISAENYELQKFEEKVIPAGYLFQKYAQILQSSALSLRFDCISTVTWIIHTRDFCQIHFYAINIISEI